MAEIRECDRCKNIFNLENGSSGVLQGLFPAEDVHLDLCDDCIDSLETFLWEFKRRKAVKK